MLGSKNSVEDIDDMNDNKNDDDKIGMQQQRRSSERDGIRRRNSKKRSNSNVRGKKRSNSIVRGKKRSNSTGGGKRRSTTNGGGTGTKGVWSRNKRGLQWNTDCHWCGGPRGKCCVWLRNKIFLKCIRGLCCHSCCPPSRKSKKKVESEPSTQSTRMSRMVAAAVLLATADQNDEKKNIPVRCCCLGEEDAFSRVQVSRCIVWCSMLMLIFGLTLQAAFVDVVYSYLMFVVLILFNQFSSLVHSDEVMLTFLVIVVYNVLMMPGPTFACCQDDLYNSTTQCLDPVYKWCSRKSIDSIRLNLLVSVKAAHSAAEAMGKQNVTSPKYQELYFNLDGTSSFSTNSWTEMTTRIGSLIMTRRPSSVFEGNWLLTFNLDRLFPVLLLVLACGQSGAYRARKLFLHHSHVIKQQEMIKLETKRHEDLLTLPREIWHLNTDNINRVIDSYGSILFADIVSFTVFSTIVSPMELVLVLNEMFQLFDKAAVSACLFERGLVLCIFLVFLF